MINKLLSRPSLHFAAIMAIAALIAYIYWPLTNAGFVWDDLVYLHDDALLRVGNNWIRGIFHVTFGAPNYFRPLVMAMFAGELKAFDSSPSSMHAVSIALHAANTALVGIVARRLILLFNASSAQTRLAYVSMLVYGLHPLLIEPIAWISCQLELLLTFLVLVGVLSNLTIRNRWIRALAVACCFFLMACTKEAAIVFPLLLATMDWLRFDPLRSHAGADRLSDQLPVYFGILLAGIGYLALRAWGLGYLILPSSIEALGLLTRLQLVCETYLTYWRVMVWPMNGIGPLHIQPAAHFAEVSLISLAKDAGALVLFAFGAYQIARRRLVGALIIGTSVTLLPVLHIFPIAFDDSYYHDHFAMSATAIASAFLPAVLLTLGFDRLEHIRLKMLGAGICAVWLLVAVFNIRMTIPLWSDETLLWQWVLHDNPDSLIAQDNLLAAFLDKDDLARARPIAARLRVDGRKCLNCMLNIAQLAILDRDPDVASLAIEDAQLAMRQEVPTQAQMVNYVSKIGDTRRLRGDFAGAEAAYRDAIDLNPLLPVPRISLATVLALQGKVADARRTADEGLALLAPDLQARRRNDFERFLERVTAAASGQTPN
jgi:hypothetical protein